MNSQLFGVTAFMAKGGTKTSASTSYVSNTKAFYPGKGF